MLVRHELDYPGWRAYVNGNRRQIRPESIFQKIELPAGDSHVTFAYTPSHIGWCYLAMGLGMLAIIARLVTDRMRNKATEAFIDLKSDDAQLKLARR